MKKKPTIAQAFKAAQKASTKKASKPSSSKKSSKSKSEEPPFNIDPTYFDAEAMWSQPGMKRLPSQGRVDDKTVHIRKGKITSADGKYDVNLSTVETPYSTLSNTRAGKQSMYKGSVTKAKKSKNR